MEHNSAEIKTRGIGYESITPSNWDDYTDMLMKEARSYLSDAKAIKKKRPSWESISRRSKSFEKLKDEYNIEECLNCFESLTEKNIGDIYLSGSVALYVQGKIARSKFQDLDIVVLGDLVMDDDMYDNPYARNYRNTYKQFDRKAIIYDDVKIDLFTNVRPGLRYIDVEYHGKIYKCQHYHDIIRAKLDMAFDTFKDFDDLIEKSFKIEYL